MTKHPQEAGDIRGICEHVCGSGVCTLVCVCGGGGFVHLVSVDVYRIDVYEWLQGVMCIGI